MDLINIITEKLAILDPIQLEITDDSAKHIGHSDNRGGGHFTLKLVSSHFSEKSQIMRHRLIYQALNELIPIQIHALSIIAIAPNDPNLKRSIID